MHTGKIKKLVRERSFGFISDTDGSEVFFHKNSLVGVEFEIEKTPKGASAVNVSIAKKQE